MMFQNDIELYPGLADGAVYSGKPRLLVEKSTRALVAKSVRGFSMTKRTAQK
jgi:hypothetical protein